MLLLYNDIILYLLFDLVGLHKLSFQNTNLLCNHCFNLQLLFGKLCLECWDTAFMSHLVANDALLHWVKAGLSSCSDLASIDGGQSWLLLGAERSIGSQCCCWGAGSESSSLCWLLSWIETCVEVLQWWGALIEFLVECSGWSVARRLAHLTGVDGFLWLFSSPGAEEAAFIGFCCGIINMVCVLVDL